ncbi:methyltransferase domain-containing protein [Luteimonas sp. SJ-92]|uniref:Methyltransferase domain-containing protein n=1 Tax=Luteimonas salinisoli TaxID=2752307 RepID=A0A853JG28_9GAMM|nr:methyltransferase domain-containing protein [Luteimonas salinisoli]NZA27527.1 methyltransferase domain-containing protein [Luteimonas salinisoli]
MPATSPAGQPGTPSDWFASPQGRAVVESEAVLVRRALDERPGRPWLWLAPVAQETDTSGHGVRLHARGQGWDGALRCALPLPLANESVGTIVLQHVAAPGEDPVALFEECARLLIPGGRLWLFTLNPLSPYRWRWRGRGLRASEPLTWRRRLRRAGLEPEPVSQGVGPGWEVAVRPGQRSGPGLCAAYALCAERRVAPLTPVAPRPAMRLPQGAAPA